ncbi:MAG: TRAP transporter permease [Eubacteriales bacterium]|nr:TRAP transporter permease [Eubacteriales bacterium]
MNAVEEVMKKYDRESNTRVWEGWQKWAVYAAFTAVALFNIYVTLFATWLDLIRYPSFVASLLFVGYLNYPMKKGTQRINYIPWYDWIIMLAGTGTFMYIVVNAYDLSMRIGVANLYWYEIILGVVGVLTLMELCRRSVGIPILCVCSVFVIYALYYYCFGRDLGAFKALRKVTIGIFYQTDGIWATPIQVCSRFIVVFIIFGAFLERTGISNFFISLANCLCGSASGGPAKVSVISSALCGMVSGSSVGNTVTTGSVTIPMMKKIGYEPEFAGAVEAAASTGGQIMPPIMGAAAFLMAEYVGVSYSDIVVRAILPAVLYFAGIFMSVHFEAKKLGLRGMSKEELPLFKELVKKTYLLLPLIILVYLVSSGTHTMAFSAIISILFAIIAANFERSRLFSLVSAIALILYLFVQMPGMAGIAVLMVGIVSCFATLFGKDVKMSPVELFDALANGTKGSISVVAACGVAGIISGCITMTGLASQIITAIISVSQGNIMAALFLTMICCIILGMGVPTTANYCIMASTCAPILIQLGIPNVAAHFFVFYFGIVADITPPVAVAAYAGAAIAKGSPMKTAVNATKLAIGAFIVPYMLALNPAMVLVDTNVVQFILIAVTSLIGMYGVTVGLEGFITSILGLPLRILIIAGGLMLIHPAIVTDIAGLVIVGAITLLQFTGKVRENKATA